MALVMTGTEFDKIDSNGYKLPESSKTPEARNTYKRPILQNVTKKSKKGQFYKIIDQTNTDNLRK